jgi:hypothetical protein
MTAKSRLSWRLGPRPVPLDDYRIMLCNTLEAVTPVAEWDPRIGIAHLEELSEAEQRIALDRWFAEVEQRVSCLTAQIARMSQIHPPDASLMGLHSAVVALGEDYAGCVGKRVDALKCAGTDDEKSLECKKKALHHRAHLSTDGEHLAEQIANLRRTCPELLAQLNLPERYSA